MQIVKDLRKVTKTIVSRIKSNEDNYFEIITKNGYLEIWEVFIGERNEN